MKLSFMKQSVRLGMILGVALAALSACSTDKANDPLASTTEGPQAIHEVPIKLSMEAEFDDEALRAMNFQLDAQNRPRVKLAGTTVPVHCVIRSDNAADPPTFVTLNFKVTGTNALKLEMTDVSLNSESNFIPTAGRRWYIMGIIGGTPVIDPGTGKPNGQVKFDSSSQPLQRVAIGSEGTSDVPYLSNWVELDLRTKAGETTYHGGAATGGLTFKPQGTLLRIQLRNNLPISHIQVHKLRTTSTVVDSKGYFNLNIPTTTTTAPWAYAEAMPATGYSRLYELSAPTLDMPAQTADNAYYLLWVMPNGSTTTGVAALTFTYTVRDRVAERLVGDGVMKLSESLASNYGTSKAIRPHASYLVRPTVDANWNPLNQMSPSNIISTVPGVFSNSFGNLEHQLYTINEATLIAVHHSTLSGGVWHLPSPEEWRTVIGDADFRLPDELKGVFSKVERVQYGRVITDVTSTYASYRNHTMAFGVRFQTTTSNPSYTAWRYEGIANPHSTGFAYVIKSRYLGPGAHETIHHTALESWWNAPVPAGAEVVRYIPLPGMASLNAYGSIVIDPLTVGFKAYYWTGHRPFGSHFTTVLAQYRGSVSSPGYLTERGHSEGNTHRHAVRLFRLP